MSLKYNPLLRVGLDDIGSGGGTSIISSGTATYFPVFSTSSTLATSCVEENADGKIRVHYGATYYVTLQVTSSGHAYLAPYTGKTLFLGSTSNWKVSSSGHFVPAFNKTQQLGSSSNRAGSFYGSRVALSCVTKTGNYTTTISDYAIFVDTSVASATITLSSSYMHSGSLLVIGDVGGNASVKNIVISPASGNIDGAASKTISTDNERLTIISDGTNWWVIGKN